MDPQPQKHVVIAGGGLAGLTAAKRLIDRGQRVSIFEGQPWLGGRASTWRDADGDWVEQGLHVFLGAYTELSRLLNEIGQPPDSVLDWMSELRMQDPTVPVQATWGTDPARAPLNALKRLAGSKDYLGPVGRIALQTHATPARGISETLRQMYDGETVIDWWRRVSSNEKVLERFIRPFCRGVQFTEPENHSAYGFLGFLSQVAQEPGQLRIAGYRGARDETHFAPLGRWLTDHGATIRVNAKLEEILFDQGRVTGFRFQGGEVVAADAFVSALPVWALLPLLPAAMRGDRFFSQLEQLPVCPAISVQLWFDRPVVGTRAYTLVANTRAAVYAEQSRNAYPTRDGGGRISVIVAPADELMAERDQALVDLVVHTIAPAQPDLAEAKVTKAVVIKHPRHLMRPLPGAMSRRPSQKTTVPNFFLAGDWTDQPFFANQEGAVRSGLLCAAAVLASSTPKRKTVKHASITLLAGPGH